jgi:formylglycine-generating enzyme required for sulfatase activity
MDGRLAQDPATALIGREIGGYRITRLIGRGGMGVVFEAQHATMGQRAAVKVLAAGARAGSTQVARLFAEARALGCIQHPGLVKIFDFGRLADQVPYILMEYLEGAPLRARLRGGALGLREALRLVRQTASALSATHAAGIVHRDLKPDNLFLVPDPEVADGERVKILDFSIAKFLNQDQSLTPAGTILGTAAYMAPEQCQDALDIDERADVYALGIILYEALSGAPPYRGSRLAVIQGHVFRPPPPLPAHVPQGVVALVNEMLAKPASSRPTMQQVVQRIQALEGPGSAPGLPAAATADAGAATGAAAAAGATDTSATPAAAMTLSALHQAPPLPAAPAVDLFMASVAPPAAAQGPPDPGRISGARRPGAPRALLALMLAAVVLAGALATQRRLRRHRPRSAAGEIFIPGGTFTMGSTRSEIAAAFAWCRRLPVENCAREIYEREQPQHLVTVSPFYLDVTEVTNARFAAFLNEQHDLTIEQGRLVRAAGVLLVDLFPGYGYGGLVFAEGRYAPRQGYAERPASLLTWEAARRYCASRGARLPTEAEWEFAARGPEGRRFPWGDQDPTCEGVVFGRKRSDQCAAQDSGPQPVGSAPQDRTPLGVLDLGGNVAEWVADGFSERYPNPSGPLIDPLAPRTTPGLRVVRGGAWHRLAESTRAAGRSRREEERVTGDIGFRCARSAAPPPTTAKRGDAS